jgi:opacity protein-like surface antigen
MRCRRLGVDARSPERSRRYATRRASADSSARFSGPTRRRSIVVVALALLVAPAAAVAQNDPFSIPPGPRRVDVSGSGGMLMSTDWSDLVLLGSISSVSGVLEQVLVRDLVVDPGPVFDAVVTYWEGRYGFRVHAGFAQSCLAVGRSCSTLATTGPSGTVDLDAWTYDIGGAIGLIDYRRNAWAWPYVFIGVGGVTYDLERTVGPPLTFIERRPPRSSNGQIVRVEDDPDQLLIAIEELGLESKLALNVGVGTDFRIPLGAASLGLRFELSDHMHRSPVDLRIANVEGFRWANDTELDFGVVHNLRAAAGLVVQFGR